MFQGPGTRWALSRDSARRRSRPPRPTGHCRHDRRGRARTRGRPNSRVTSRHLDQSETLRGFCTSGALPDNRSIRVSSESDRQNSDLQRDALIAVGVDSRNLFEDRASGARTDRPGLTQALAFVRPGDVLPSCSFYFAFPHAINTHNSGPSGPRETAPATWARRRGQRTGCRVSSSSPGRRCARRDRLGPMAWCCRPELARREVFDSRRLSERGDGLLFLTK
jgi:hypothetical protein